MFEHTKQAIDAASMLSYIDDDEKIIVMYAALCHDLGKVTTTKIHENKITSYGHAKESERFAKRFMRRITRNKKLLVAVSKLVRYHMHPIQFIQSEARLSAYKRLAKKLAPEVTLQMLAKIALVDKRGRNPEKGMPLSGPVLEVDEFLKKAQEAQVLEQVEEPIL